jgi:hypothetical protein
MQEDGYLNRFFVNLLLSRQAMVMCASTPEKVEILSPPAGSKPGDVVVVDGFLRNPDSQLNPKKKIFETCAPDLTVNGNKEACYKVAHFQLTLYNKLSLYLRIKRVLIFCFHCHWMVVKNAKLSLSWALSHIFLNPRHKTEDIRC